MWEWLVRPVILLIEWNWPWLEAFPYEMDLPALVEDSPGMSALQGGHVEDLDVFYKRVYAYYFHKGLDVIAISAAELVNLAVTVLVSVFLLLIDWRSIYSDCSSSSSRDAADGEVIQCHGALSDYVVPPWGSRSSFFFSGFILAYLLLFTCYFLWKILRAVKRISEALTMRRFYEHKFM